MNFKSKFLCLFLATSAFLLNSCKDPVKSVWTDLSKVNVVATTTMISDLTLQIGGDKVEVKNLMNHKIDPHGYTQTKEDTTALKTADVIFYNGLNLEAKMQKGLEHMASKGNAAYAVTSSIPESMLLNAEGERDPHVWGDPLVWIHTIDVVTNGLIKADPDNKKFYQTNATNYKQELETLDKWAVEQIHLIPEDKRVLVTAHDAFQYFSHRYKLEVKALQGVSSADEAGIRAVQELTDFIKSRNIPTIFAESTTNDKGVGSIAKNSGARLNDIPLYADACGPLGEVNEVNGEKYDVGTYTGMIKHNVNTIVGALKE